MLKTFKDLYAPYTILTSAQRFVLREVFAFMPHGDFAGCDCVATYIVHKCEKNGASLRECRRLLGILNLHDGACRVDCAICRRLETYHVAT